MDQADIKPKSEPELQAQADTGAGQMLQPETEAKPSPLQIRAEINPEQVLQLLASDGETQKPTKASRHLRGFLKGVLRVLLCFALIAACLAGYVFVNALYSKTHYNIVFYQDVSRYLTENLRIIFITDLHCREYGEGNSELLADISSLDPDIILLGGDMINRDDGDYESMLALCGNLAQIAPVYGVLGNHESERMYSLGDMTVPDRFREAGMHLIRNDTEIVRLGNNSIQLIGLEGTEAGIDLYGAREKLEEMEFRDDMYKVMLAHIPILFRQKLAPYSYDLGLAGHVHGGIVRLPFIGGIYSDEEKLFPKYCRGKYDMGRGRKLIISGGMADSKWFPRVNNTPELIVIDVNWC